MNQLFLLGPNTTDFYAFQVKSGKMNQAWLFFRELGWYINHEGGLMSQKSANYFFATPSYGNPGIRVMEVVEPFLPEIQGKTLPLALHFEDSTPEEAAKVILNWAKSNDVSGSASIGQDEAKIIVLIPQLFNFEIEIS